MIGSACTFALYLPYSSMSSRPRSERAGDLRDRAQLRAWAISMSVSMRVPHAVVAESLRTVAPGKAAPALNTRGAARIKPGAFLAPLSDARPSSVPVR
jgi:hypothetical protein